MIQGLHIEWRHKLESLHEAAQRTAIDAVYHARDSGGTMHDGDLSGGALACRHCRRSYFLPRAGRSMDDSKLQLEPVPLLRERGHVKVALAA